MTTNWRTTIQRAEARDQQERDRLPDDEGLLAHQEPREPLVLLIALAQLSHHRLHLDLQKINGIGLLGVADNQLCQPPLYLITLSSTTIDMTVQLLKILVNTGDGITESFIHGLVVRLEGGDLVLNFSLTTSLVVERLLVESMGVIDLELPLQHIVKYKWTKREVPSFPPQKCTEERGRSRSTSGKVPDEGSISQSKQERRP